jgi:hypothetical protein
MCIRLGLVGGPVEWNTGLMNIRKEGYLKKLPRARTTSISWEDFASHRFACEIALQKFKQDGLTLDKLLCDPFKALDFDRFVRDILNEQLPSLSIRWIALWLRKRATSVRKSAVTLKDSVSLPNNSNLASNLNLANVPEAPGLYWLQDPHKKLYVGETHNLRQRLAIHIKPFPLSIWNSTPSELRIRHKSFDVPDDLGSNQLRQDLERHQSRWIARWDCPVGNYSKLAAI